jgi:putative alpha-1,2-mannosidase
MRVALLLALGASAFAGATDYTKYVNLFIGTEGPKPGSAFSSGNVFPGAALPFGAVKVGIDTTRYVPHRGAYLILKVQIADCSDGTPRPLPMPVTHLTGM